MKINTTFDTYKQATGLNGNVDKRGSKIVAVDRAFKDYADQFDAANPATKLALTVELFVSCKIWLQKKADKSDINKGILFADKVNQNLVNRRKQISDIALECLWAMAVMDPTLVPQATFDIKKIAALAQGKDKPEVKALAAGYENERKLYLAGKKTSSPPSATILGGLIGHSAVEGLDLKAYKKQVDLHNVGLVKFLKKAERLRSLASPNAAGLLERPADGSIVDCGYAVAATPAVMFVEAKKKACQTAMYAYAMDRYGNLITNEVEDGATLAAGGYASFNHSSFNAGADVICAGLLLVVKGKLRWIDNNSGHYKPTADNLRNAIEMLANDQADLGDLCVGVMVFKPAFAVHCFSRDAFLRKVATPDVGII